METNSFISDLIQENGGLGHILTKKIFISALKEYQNKKITIEDVADISHSLLNMYNEEEEIDKNDHELFAILHDISDYAIENVSYVDGDKRVELSKEEKKERAIRCSNEYLVTQTS